MKLKCNLALSVTMAVFMMGDFGNALAQSRLLPLRKVSVRNSNRRMYRTSDNNASKLAVSISSPEGFEFAGVDENEVSMGDYGFAPANTYLSAKAKSNSKTAAYTWEYYTTSGLLGSKINKSTSSSQTITFKLPSGLQIAPKVTATDPTSTATATASLGSDGIYFGEGYNGNHDCVNYHPNVCNGYYTDASTLALNSKEANEGLNYIWASTGINGFKLLGFAEAFTYSAPYYLEGVTAEVSSETTLTESDIEAHLYARKRGNDGGYRVDSMDLVNLHVSQIIPSNIQNRYRVVFAPDSVIQIKSAVEAVITTPSESTCKLQIVFPESKEYNSDNTGICSLYADFKIGSSQITKSYLDFAGVEMADENGKTTGFLNNFMIGLRKSYTKSTTGLKKVTIQNHLSSKIYNVSGQNLGGNKSIVNVPHGISLVST